MVSDREAYMAHKQKWDQAIADMNQILHQIGGAVETARQRLRRHRAGRRQRLGLESHPSVLAPARAAGARAAGPAAPSRPVPEGGNTMSQPTCHRRPSIPPARPGRRGPRADPAVHRDALPRRHAGHHRGPRQRDERGTTGTRRTSSPGGPPLRRLRSGFEMQEQQRQRLPRRAVDAARGRRAPLPGRRGDPDHRRELPDGRGAQPGPGRGHRARPVRLPAHAAGNSSSRGPVMA